MAIFHCSVQKIGRRDGRSSTAAAAYRTAQCIHDELTGTIYDYRRKSGVLEHDRIGWSGDSSSLWNAAEKAETNANGTMRMRAVVAREIVLALPHELSPGQRNRLVRNFAKSLRRAYGVAVEYAIHAPHRDSDERNFHAHIMLTTRAVDNNEFGAKTRVLDDRKTGPREIEKIRSDWAQMTNEHLKEFAPDTPCINAASYRKQKEEGLVPDALEPGRHLGPAVTNWARRAERTGDELPVLFQREQERRFRNQIAMANWWQLRSLGSKAQHLAQIDTAEHEEGLDPLTEEIFRMANQKGIFTKLLMRFRGGASTKKRECNPAPRSPAETSPVSQKSNAEIFQAKVREKEREELERERKFYEDQQILQLLQDHYQSLKSGGGQRMSAARLISRTEEVLGIPGVVAKSFINRHFERKAPHLYDAHIDSIRKPEAEGVWEKHVAAAKKRKAENARKPRQRRRRDRGRDMED